jgi:hypothetical protein
MISRSFGGVFSASLIVSVGKGTMALSSGANEELFSRFVVFILLHLGRRGLGRFEFLTAPFPDMLMKLHCGILCI